MFWPSFRGITGNLAFSEVIFLFLNVLYPTHCVPWRPRILTRFSTKLFFSVAFYLVRPSITLLAQHKILFLCPDSDLGYNGSARYKISKQNRHPLSFHENLKVIRFQIDISLLNQYLTKAVPDIKFEYRTRLVRRGRTSDRSEFGRFLPAALM